MNKYACFGVMILMVFSASFYSCKKSDSAKVLKIKAFVAYALGNIDDPSTEKARTVFEASFKKLAGILEKDNDNVPAETWDILSMADEIRKTIHADPIYVDIKEVGEKHCSPDLKMRSFDVRNSIVSILNVQRSELKCDGGNMCLLYRNGKDLNVMFTFYTLTPEQHFLGTCYEKNSCLMGETKSDYDILYDFKKDNKGYMVRYNKGVKPFNVLGKSVEFYSVDFNLDGSQSAYVRDSDGTPYFLIYDADNILTKAVKREASKNHTLAKKEIAQLEDLRVRMDEYTKSVDNFKNHGERVYQLFQEALNCLAVQ